MDSIIPIQQKQSHLNLVPSFLMNTNEQQCQCKSQTEQQCEHYGLDANANTNTNAINNTTSQYCQDETVTKSQNNYNMINEEEQSISIESMESTDEGMPAQSNENENAYEYNDLLILMDWDDTLFPTSTINEILSRRDNNDLALIPDHQINLVYKLGNVTYKLLHELITKYGAHSIHIVTNSLHGWIKESIAYAACINNIYKQIEMLLIQNNITMISAQTMYKLKGGKDSTPTVWKQLCFEDILKQNHKYSHILSIGDQWTDHFAVKQCIANVYNNTTNDNSKAIPLPVHHVIKLKMNPNLNDMINEILYIQTCFYQIFDIIAYKTTPFFSSAQSIQPVIIDYFEEEMKYLNLYNDNQKQCININVNVNVNVNVNMNENSNTESPKQYMK